MYAFKRGEGDLKKRMFSTFALMGKNVTFQGSTKSNMVLKYTSGYKRKKSSKCKCITKFTGVKKDLVGPLAPFPYSGSVTLSSNSN